MTGPEHYAAAERLITIARQESNLMGQVYGKDQEYAELRLAEAQVHATLALVAAAGGDVAR